MTQWLRYHITIRNLVFQSKTHFFAHCNYFPCYTGPIPLQLSGCSQPARSTSLFLMDVLGEPLRILREKSHYSAYLLTPFQNNTKMLKTSLFWVSAPSFKDNSCGAFTVHTVSALSSSIHYIIFCYLSAYASLTLAVFLFNTVVLKKFEERRKNTENNTLGKPLYVKGCGTK